jgi:hypothetical protein
LGTELRELYDRHGARHAGVLAELASPVAYPAPLPPPPPRFNGRQTHEKLQQKSSAAVDRMLPHQVQNRTRPA